MMTKSQLDAQIARHREQIDALCADLAACNDRAARIEKAAVDLLGALAEITLTEGRRIPIEEQREIQMHRDEAIDALRAAVARKGG